MMKCDLCEKYQVDRHGNFTCNATFPEAHCKMAIGRIMEISKNVEAAKQRDAQRQQDYYVNDANSLYEKMFGKG